MNCFFKRFYTKSATVIAIFDMNFIKTWFSWKIMKIYPFIEKINKCFKMTQIQIYLDLMFRTQKKASEAFSINILCIHFHIIHKTRKKNSLKDFKCFVH